jgi:hypothetical protein
MGTTNMFGDKLTDFIQVYHNVISPESCKRIISQYETHQEYIQEHDTALYKFHQLDLNHTPDLVGLAGAYAGSLLPCYEDYFNKLRLRQFVTFDTWEDVRIKKYLRGSGDEFRTHVDVSDHASAARFCIAILYLNDNNGLTTFPNLGVGVQPEAGKVVIFPPSWMFPHNGKSPTDNDKYIMMTSLHYK